MVSWLLASVEAGNVCRSMGEQAPSEKGSVNEEEVQAWVDSRQFFSLSPSLSFFFFDDDEINMY